jgi:DNA-binding transcriptional ArsR family regulator
VGEHPADDNLRIVCRPDLRGVVDLCRPTDFDSLRDWIARDSLKLVVLDAFSRAHTASENKAEEVNAVLAGIDAVRHDTGCAFLLVHHERKSMAGGSDDDRDALRGSSRFQSDPTLLVRVKATTGGLKSVTFVKISEGPDIEDIHLRTTEGGFPMVVPSPGSVADGNRQRVLDMILNTPASLSAGEVASATGMAAHTVKRHLESLVSDGKVVRSGEKRWTRYRSIAQPIENGVRYDSNTHASKDLWDSADSIEQ